MHLLTTVVLIITQASHHHSTDTHVSIEFHTCKYYLYLTTVALFNIKKIEHWDLKTSYVIVS